MTNKFKRWIDRGRASLKDILPLNTPITMNIEPSRACNFKCIYCSHSVKGPLTKSNDIMSIEMFKKFINDMKNFPKKLKVLQFSGLGEPLLNKDIAQMVELSKSIAEKVVLYSNGSLLSPKNSTLLINSGLDTIRISMQGVSCEDYKKVSDVDIVFDELISNIRSLYEHKGSCEVFIKMPDIILKDEKKRESFREIFENICDAMSVESISPLFSDVDYSTIKDKYDSSIYEQALSEPIQICPQPFYTMYLMANGNIMPCCISEMDNYLIGNITEDNIFDVWNGHRLKEFRLKQAKGLRSIFPACKKCNFIKYGICESDNIDSIGDNLIQIYK